MELTQDQKIIQKALANEPLKKLLLALVLLALISIPVVAGFFPEGQFTPRIESGQVYFIVMMLFILGVAAWFTVQFVIVYATEPEIVEALREGSNIQIVWIYTREVTRRGVRVGVEIHAGLSTGKLVKMVTGGHTEYQRPLEILKSYFPKAPYGYSPKLLEMFKNDPMSLLTVTVTPKDQATSQVRQNT